MSKENSKKMIEEIFDGTVSAAECTGLLQKMALNTEEIKRYHKEYTKDDK